MTTYTIAYTKPESDGGISRLIATVPERGDVYATVKAAVRQEQLDLIDESGKAPAIAWDAVSGLVLTDDEPPDESRIIWQGQDRGWLMDENGKTYQYAVRP